jgi:hypothetical protein
MVAAGDAARLSKSAWVLLTNACDGVSRAEELQMTAPHSNGPASLVGCSFHQYTLRHCDAGRMQLDQ